MTNHDQHQDHDTGFKVLLYSHDSYGLGHFRRTSAIAHAIARVRPGTSQLCVTGSPRPDLFPLPAGADYVKLPSVTKNTAGDYVPLGLEGRLDAVVQIRAEMIATIARSFRPDVVLVDHTPLGVGGELIPMLEEQRARGDEVCVVLGMRDILDGPGRAARQLAHPAVRRVLDELYDHLLVYGHRHVCDVAVEYELPDGLAERLEYVGVACCVDELESRRLGAMRPDPIRPAHVLVTTGGGGDGAELLESSLEALADGWEDHEMRATVITGPFLDERIRERLAERARGLSHVSLLEATPGLHDMLGETDLVVTMGGYNSVYEGLCMQRRLLVLPRVNPRREQEDRVRRLAALGLVERLGSEDLADPARLRRRMRDAISGERPNARAAGIRFDGAAHAARLLAGNARLIARHDDATRHDSTPRENLA